MKFSKEKLDKVIGVSKKAALGAGKKLLARQKKIHSLKISVKEAQGVVSEADVEAENFIIKTLKHEFPDYSFLAEEHFYKNYADVKTIPQELQKAEWLWIIDPLDGTTNFLNGMDYFAVCISLAYRGMPVTGLVYRPSTGDCYFAKKGRGSWICDLNSEGRAKRLIVENNRKKLRDSLLVTGFATEKGGKLFDQEFAMFKGLMAKSRGVRRMGSAALDLCLVGQGIFDVFWERNLAPWDVAASGLICQESLVKVSDYEGRSFHPFQDTIVAARKPLHLEFMRALKEKLSH